MQKYILVQANTCGKGEVFLYISKLNLILKILRSEVLKTNTEFNICFFSFFSEYILYLLTVDHL